MSLSNSYNIKQKILLTGFDSFEMNGVVVGKNTSGEAVKMVNMMKKIVEETYNIDLFTELVPVEYEYIDKNLPEIWNKLQPSLSIHVGVSEFSTGLTLEMLAKKALYKMKDNRGKLPEAYMNPCTGPNCLATDLQVDRICDEFNQDLPEGILRAGVSYNAGMYVCEYMFYTSLSLYEQMDKRKSSIFVHVPFMTS